MKIFVSSQIRQIDEYTIEDEPVASFDLMERAAGQILKWCLEKVERSGKIFIFVGPGNNGGDGLALARLLNANRYEVHVYYIDFTEKTSSDWNRNLERLNSETDIRMKSLTAADQFPVISSEDTVIDAIFGSGLSRPANGLASEVIKLINKVGSKVVSIDIPSGLFGEDNTKNNHESIVSADYTLSFQFPKLSFMFPENSGFLGEWIILPIGLSGKAIRNTISPYILLEKSDIAPLLKKRNKFDHKGNFGHGILFSGSYGKMGAAVLGAEAALRTGIGLLTCHVPSLGVTIIQTAVPEAMVQPDINERYISEITDTDMFSALGIGPGIGVGTESQNAVCKLLKDCTKPIVIDADALNILSMEKNRLSLIPEGAILTPHPKEFERLAGKSDNGYQRLTRQIKFSLDHKCVVVLKGAHTSVTTADGRVFFNSTGNPGMATAGSGDVLTGILLSLLSQGYSSADAAITGVYIHGLAGDFAAGELCYESIIAGDIIKNLAAAFIRIRET
jgi:ADP-dependent NAD(P)H-hydrate dehydratase / NAD(P)H-hydrate epimerase